VEASVGRRPAVASEGPDGADRGSRPRSRGDALGMSLVLNDDVVEAVSAERADHPFGERIAGGRARRSGQKSGAEAVDAVPEISAEDGVSVVDEKPRRFQRIAGGLDDALAAQPALG
jgi:hypothetical protein